MSSDARQRLGSLGEQLAADHLERLGFRILERNYRTRLGELDIVAFDGRTLVFCEVKTLRARAGGIAPLEGVRPRKRHQVRRMAGCWLSDRRGHPFAARLRFDAIGVLLDRSDRLVSLDHLESAF